MKQAFQAGLISVIIPTFNRAELVGEALASVLAQDHGPLEIIVADDGSTDNTEQVVSRMRSGSDRTDVSWMYLRQAHSGAPTARNMALRESNGEAIQFVDSDDLIHPQKLSSNYAHLRGEQHDIVWGKLQWINGREKLADTVFDRVSAFHRASPADIPNSINQSLVHRNLCNRLGPWATGLKRYQDWELSVRATALRPKCSATATPLYFAVRHKLGRIADGHRTNVDLTRFAAAAVASAESNIHDCPDPAARLRIAQKALDAFVGSLTFGDREQAGAALAAVRRNMGIDHRSRLKAEAFWRASAILGDKLTRKLANRAQVGL